MSTPEFFSPTGAGTDFHILIWRGGKIFGGGGVFFHQN